MVVVLPMPLRPSKVTTSPAPTLNPMSNSTCAGPYADCRCSTASIAASLHLVAEIGGDHPRIGTDLGGRAGCDDVTVDQHRNTVGQREHGRHVMLDQHDREPSFELPQHANEARGLVAPGARHWLIEQQQFRLHRERNGEFERPFFPMRELPCWRERALD